MRQRPAVVVGAGPAGMAAAVAIAEAGVDVTVIDEQARVGGQIHRSPHPALSRDPHHRRDPTARRGEKLKRRFQSAGERIELLTETTVWGIFDSRRLAVSGVRGSEMIEAHRLVLATGAYEYVAPFSGWTLPGVFTAGGAQIMVEALRVRPGRRALVAGTGPFLLVVANALHQAGVAVVGVVEAVAFAELLGALPGLASQPGQLYQGWRYVRSLRRAGIPHHPGHVIVEARGDAQVTHAVFAPCDRHWRPDPTRRSVVAVDAVCVGYGFVPRTALAQLCGCRLRYADELGGWIPEVDGELQTSVPGVFAVGDGGGIAGALVAELEGRLAGLAVARDAGVLDRAHFAARTRPLRRRLAYMRRFRSALDRLSRVRPGLADLATHETVVCRCEEVTRCEVDAGIAAGGTDIRTLKVATRVGMGPCQGRMCWPAMTRYVSRHSGQPIERVGPLRVRPPIKPVALGELAQFPGVPSP